MNRKAFFTIIMMDVSSCMAKNEKMAQANSCYLRIYSKLQKIQKEYSELDIKIATMLIGNMPRWIKEITLIDRYSASEIECEQGTANYKDALIELNKKLSRKEFMSFEGKIAQPTIILITDAEEPFANCSEQLEELNNNMWFKCSFRLVYIVGRRHQDFQNDGFCMFCRGFGDEGIYFEGEELVNAICEGYGLYPDPILKHRHYIKTIYGETDRDDVSDFGGYEGISFDDIWNFDDFDNENFI